MFDSNTTIGVSILVYFGSYIYVECKICTKYSSSRIFYKITYLEYLTTRIYNRIKIAIFVQIVHLRIIVTAVFIGLVV